MNPTRFRIAALAMAIALGLITYFIHGTLNNFLDTDKEVCTFGEPNDGLFEPTLAWLEHLRLVYQNTMSLYSQLFYSFKDEP